MRAADQEGQWDSKCQGEEVGKEVQSWGGRGAERVCQWTGAWGGGFRDLPQKCAAGHRLHSLEAQARSLKERQEPKILGRITGVPLDYALRAATAVQKGSRVVKSRLDGTRQQSASSALEDVVPGATSWPKRADKRLAGPHWRRTMITETERARPVWYMYVWLTEPPCCILGALCINYTSI